MDNVGRYRISEAGSDVTLKYNGAEVHASTFADWTAMAIAPMAGSLDNTVLWRQSSGGYSQWRVDDNGNHQSSKLLSTYELASMESTFGIDLNANGFIGSYLGQNAGGYTLGQSVTLKLNGSQVNSNSFTNWSAVAAGGTTGGNQVAWRNSTTFAVWATDEQGNYQTAVAANSVQIGAYENLFAEDLNGNGILDSLRTVEAFGTTSVAVDLNGGYSLSSARGVQLLQLNGQQVTDSQFSGWQVVGAEDTVTGFQVVFKNATSGASSYWNTDANGNYLAGKVLNGSQLKAFETSFQQDLDNSGTVDPLTQVEIVGSASLLQQANGGYVIDGANGIQFLNYQGTQITPGFAPGWTLNGVEGQDQSSGYVANWTAPNGTQQYNWFTNSTGDYLSAGLA
jgi:serralysin